jgi:hypothetical protein
MTGVSLTEEDAAHAWALAYNTHDPSALASILADDVRVMSRWVVTDLVGRDAYLEYLDRKFSTFERVGSVIRVEVAETPGSTEGARGRPCALIEQDGTLLATVIFDVVCGRLTQVSLSENPAPEECLGSGVYPGFSETELPRVN